MTTSKCLNLVTRGHFRDVTKMASTLAENHMLHANVMALCFTEPKLLPIEVLHCGNRDVGPFWLLWPWPWAYDLHIRIWHVFPGDIPDVWEWTSYVKAFESYRLTDGQTDRQTDRHATSRVVTKGFNSRLQVAKTCSVDDNDKTTSIAWCTIFTKQAFNRLSF